MSKSKIGTVEAIMIILTIIVAHTILSLPKNILTSMKSASILNLIYVSIIVVALGYLVYRLLRKFPGLDIIDSDIFIFIFTLNSNGRSDIEKFNSKKVVYTHLYDNGFYYCGNIGYDAGYYSVIDIGKANSRFHEDISHFFYIDNPEIFTGSCYSFGYDNFYKPERVVVIEMN